MRSNEILSEVQAAIGRHLGAECELAQPIPARLVDLLRQVEQRHDEPKASPRRLRSQDLRIRDLCNPANIAVERSRTTICEEW
jgi:hypothetical protein